MRKNRRKGTSLIEILVVIVVFLVGILSLVQVFPLGLGVLRRTNTMTTGLSVARAELERVNARSGQIPEMIAGVNYLPGFGVVVTGDRNWNDLLPDRDNLGVGRLQVVTKDGSDRYPAGTRVAEVVDAASNSIGAWQHVSGANHFTRVFGEGGRVPAPRTVGSLSGGLLQLQFAPIYYFRDTGTGLAANGLVQIYGNDLTRRDGASDNRVPDALLEADDYAFYSMPGAYATDPAETPFPNDDQIWVGAVQNGGPVPHRLRVSVSFGHQVGAGTEEVQVVTEASLAESSTLGPGLEYMTLVNNQYWVVSLPRLLSKPGSPYALADYRGADVVSMRVQRLYDELPLSGAFDPNNPYQYMVLDAGNAANSVAGLGNILVNPSAFNATVGSDRGLEPLHARVDYTVFDWRIVKDDFRVPLESSPRSIKLTLNSIKTLSGIGPDTLSRTGMELSVPNVAGDVINAASSKQIPQDFVLIDQQTGGVILGNAGGANSSYTVNKRTGVIEFHDLDPAAGIQGRISVPDPGSASGWSAPFTANLEGRPVRALYMGTNEFAVQAHKAANTYSVGGLTAGSGLLPGRCYVGGSRTNGGGGAMGQTSRIYFPVSDLGHRVTIGEIWRENGGNVELLQDRDFQINGTEQVEGVTLAYIDVGGPLSAARTGYAVRNVAGLTVKVRVLWNPEYFEVDGTPLENFDALEVWARGWRRVEATDVFSRSVN